MHILHCNRVEHFAYQSVHVCSTADFEKFSASLFAPAFHPTPALLPPFSGPSRSNNNNNLDDDDSRVESEHEWLDESQFTQKVPSNVSEVAAIEVHHFLFFFLSFFFTPTFFFVEAIVAGFACSSFHWCKPSFLFDCRHFHNTGEL